MMKNIQGFASRRWRDTWRTLGHRPAALVMAAIITTSTVGYTFGVVAYQLRYHLDGSSLQLIGKLNGELAKKVKYDDKLDAYRFNAESITPDMTDESDPAKVAALLASQKQQTGGGGKDTKNLYSLDLPVDPKKGTTVYDSNSKSSFKIIPQFSTENGQREAQRIVYPINGGGQAVYSVKGNGVKEDIVLTKPRGNDLEFQYKLQLPSSLTARLDDRGNLGIYGVDPQVIAALGNSGDTARLKDVTDHGAKNHLIYLIPAPTIKQSGSRPNGHHAKAMYHLNGDKLTVQAQGLETLTYPISIDPSVVITTTADFGTGNNEGMISYDTDAISRAAPTNGTTGAWVTTTSLTTAEDQHASVAYNGYLYVTGGVNSTNSANVQYAPINANGTIGTWAATTSFTTARYGHTSVAYNGYLYVIGGYITTYLADVQYAPINANGTIGTWAATTSFPSARYAHTSVAYNGYLYVIGGYDGVGGTANVQYAPINANGTIGTWAATTSFPTARYSHTSVAYNGYLYVIGGTGSTNLADVQYAPINANGTIGTWAATTSFTTARSAHTSVAYNGYLYVIGGKDTTNSYNDVQYAPINTNGTIGTWAATTSFTTARSAHTSVAYNGYLYVIAGMNASSAVLSDVQVSLLDPESNPTFTMPAWTTSATPLGLASGAATTKVSTRSNHTSLAYNGYLYEVGGTMNSTTTLTSVQYAPINADSTIGVWSATTALPAVRQGHSSIILNGYLYVIGGQDGVPSMTSTVYYAQLAANGTVGAWNTTTALTAGRSNASVAAYNGYLYVAGGLITTSGTLDTAVTYAPINTNGTVGAWTATTALPATRAVHQSFAYNNYLYIIGGNSGGTTATTLYAPINVNGTIGAWVSTTSMTTPRSYFSGQLYDGYFIVAAGYNGTTVLSTTEYAKVNADGTLGAWTAGPSVSVARESAAMAIYNSTIYLSGGDNASTTYYPDIFYTKLTNVRTGGPATYGTLPNWSSSTVVNTAIYGQETVVYNNVIYVVGGHDSSTYLNTVRYAPLNADGTVGTWTTSANLMGVPRHMPGAVAYNGFLYALGGQTASGTYSNTVEYAPINADGSIGAFTTSANTFTTARFGHVASAYNGRLYIVGGGDTAGNPLGDVKFATINADGSIGTWADTTAMAAFRDTSQFIYNGWVYVVGGVNGTIYSNTIRYAKINADGTIGAWTTSPFGFATARSRMGVVAANGYVYISGGAQSAALGDLQYAQINSDGSIEPWATTTSSTTASGSPTTFYYHSLVANKGRLYSLGGFNGSSVAQNGVYMTTVNVPALSAFYSQQITLTGLNTVASVVATGTLTGVTLQYRTAGADGLYGAWQSGTVAATNAQYVMYKITIDNNTSPDYFNGTGRSSIADVTINYTPNGPTPDQRLRQGKYFDSTGVLQPLQTP